MFLIRFQYFGRVINKQIYRQYYKPPTKLQLSYSFMPGDVPLLHSTLGKLVDKSASEAGDHTAFVAPHQNIRKSFSEFKTDVDKLASGLLALGLRKGDRIGLCLPNIYEWPVTQFAIAKAGLILVSINLAYQADELEYCLNKVGIKALITSETYKTQNFYEMLCSFLPEIPNSTPGALQANRMKNLKTVILLSDEARSGTITFKDVLEASNKESNNLLLTTEDLVQFDDIVNIQFTSGTTGNPKAAIITHHSIINSAFLGGRRAGYDIVKPIRCCPVPLYHIFGYLTSVSAVLFQYTCVFPSPSYDCDASIRAVEMEKCTSINGAPTMFVDLLQKVTPQNKLSSLNIAVISGAFCPETVISEIYNKLNISNIYIGYGSTESIAISGNFSDDSLSTVVSSYMPAMDYVEIKVVDSDNHLLPIGSEGEICARGYLIFPGYWDDEKKTKEVLSSTNWYHTGDMGRMNEDGYIKITGRKKDMIIRGGENIYPVEIENFLHKHPSILEAHICGVPDARMGEELCAWIKLKEKEVLSKEVVKNYCKGKIAHFKIPRYIVFVDNFPKTVSGKVQKFKMRETSIKKLSI